MKGVHLHNLRHFPFLIFFHWFFMLYHYTNTKLLTNSFFVSIIFDSSLFSFIQVFIIQGLEAFTNPCLPGSGHTVKSVVMNHGSEWKDVRVPNRLVKSTIGNCSSRHSHYRNLTRPNHNFKMYRKTNCYKYCIVALHKTRSGH